VRRSLTLVDALGRRKICFGEMPVDSASSLAYREPIMAKKKYGKKAQSSVKSAMRKMKKGKLTSGKSKKKVTSRKQAIAIGLSEARKKGAKVPKKRKSSK
jgi:hypothetical protein